MTRIRIPLERHREPENPFAILVIACCVCAALGIIGLGMAAAAGISW